MNESDGGISSYAVSGLKGANQILTAHDFDWPSIHLREHPAQFIRVLPYLYLKTTYSFSALGYKFRGVVIEHLVSIFDSFSILSTSTSL